MNENLIGLFGGLLMICIIALVFIAIYIIPFWRIFQRTGQSGAMSLLLLIPLVNIIMFYLLAFGNWPIENELNQLRMKLNK